MSKIFFILFLLFSSLSSIANYRDDVNPSDAVINHLIQELLVYRKQTKPMQNVFAITRDGSVVLYGEVDSDKSRQEIFQMVASIPGVRGVLNQVTIKQPLDQNWPMIKRHTR